MTAPNPAAAVPNVLSDYWLDAPPIENLEQYGAAMYRIEQCQDIIADTIKPFNTADLSSLAIAAAQMVHLVNLLKGWEANHGVPVYIDPPVVLDLSNPHPIFLEGEQGKPYFDALG